MSFELGPGEKCRVNRDCTDEGELAFTEGSLVVIEDISPDRLRPGAKYVVFSARLGRHVRLCGHDLDRVVCKVCGAELSREAKECPACGWQTPESESDRIYDQSREYYSRRMRQKGGYSDF